ncbi:MAG TPA: sulfite exporter TauE/SafE family protein [Alphaproteobacteria bacterium]|nr:sulfite exporter TauE/SafE family protein [Alphaproteobacteria bacterium]HOO51659.1 sulfite exporter TauE/SafE family protein [Alphaproteobacteria bacterium]
MTTDSFLHLDGSYYGLTLFFVGLASGIIGAIGGSGGLIILPFMILSGYAPAMAIGTARFASIPSWIIAAKKYNNAKQIRWEDIPLLTILAIIGGAIGTYLIIDIDQNYVYPIVGTMLMLISPLALLKKDFGLKNIDHNKNRRVTGFTLYFLTLIYAGFFGGGASVLIIFILVTFLGYRFLEAHATDTTAWIAMSVASSAIFIWHDQVDYTNALVIFISMAIGSYLGSHIAIKKGDKWVRIVVCSFALIVGIKLLFFP